MYYAIVTLSMFLLPLVSIGIDIGTHQAPVLAAVGKWYVFWAVGIRLLLAGLRQSVQPRYTAKHILGIEGDEALLLVRELGFANIALGLVGTASLFAASWTQPAALAGGVFYLLAGIGHVFQHERNRLEQVAMYSDLFAGVVLLGFFCAAAALA